ncbi:hypothetical protein LCGC14_2908550, partial [marine sediment metagenome]
VLERPNGLPPARPPRRRGLPQLGPGHLGVHVGEQIPYRARGDLPVRALLNRLELGPGKVLRYPRYGNIHPRVVGVGGIGPAHPHAAILPVPLREDACEQCCRG